MNWTFNNYKHYSAEHLHKADKARLTRESLIQREKRPKQMWQAASAQSPIRTHRNHA